MVFFFFWFARENQKQKIGFVEFFIWISIVEQNTTFQIVYTQPRIRVFMFITFDI